MRRLFWVALGAAAGVLVVRKATKTAQAYTPEGMASSVSSLGDAVREFAAVVREGMAEREEELRLALGVDAGSVDQREIRPGEISTREISEERARYLIENPTSPRQD